LDPLNNLSDYEFAELLKVFFPCVNNTGEKPLHFWDGILVTLMFI
jgi:hypothetical protein